MFTESVNKVTRWLLTALVGLPYFLTVVLIAFRYFRVIVQRLFTAFPG